MSNIMKEKCAAAFFCFISVVSFSQEVFEWQENVSLTMRDYSSVESEINPDCNLYSIKSEIAMDFSFSMKAVMFAAAKHLNNKVTTKFNRAASYLLAPNEEIANRLLAFGNFEFDLVELYSRKFRKALFNEKKSFSNARYFEPIYEEIHKQLNAHHSRVSKLTNVGRQEELLAEEHLKVMAELKEYIDFCKECKPSKAVKD
jgi:hypothetical protein